MPLTIWQPFEPHHQFPNGPNLRKDQVEKRLAASQRVDMEERVDAPNCQVTSSQACNLRSRHGHVAVPR